MKAEISRVAKKYIHIKTCAISCMSFLNTEVLT